MTGYRNKVEFTIGRSFTGSVEKQGPIIVGFSHGNLSKGIMYTGSAANICVISEESRYVAKELEKIIQSFNEKHGIEFYDKIHNKGFWRILLYRESKETRECMISVIVSETVQADEKAEVEKGIPTQEQL